MVVAVAEEEGAMAEVVVAVVGPAPTHLTR
jgi:hypothetical protein